MALSRGARIEASINKRMVHRRWQQGWRPRVVAFTGYGSRKFVRVLARIVLEDPAAEEVDPTRDDALAEAQRGWRLYRTTHVSGLPVRNARPPLGLFFSFKQGIRI